MSNQFEPGTYVILAGHKDWGLGQVQCVVGVRVTVNFEHAGKRLINIAHAELKSATPDEIKELERS
ncbi:MAG: DUF3553 domain-containing protein [Alphaproteobacteria bacterium]|nr:DUF3553 domain-containing protein [Alphaproteobacteria bacterium]